MQWNFIIKVCSELSACISFVKVVYVVDSYFNIVLQGGFVGLAKATSLKTAEVGKAVKKGEGNLKAPFALIIEVSICGYSIYRLMIMLEYVIAL